MRVAGSLYLGPDRSGVRWLLDPAAPGLAGLSRAVQARREDTRCDPEAVAADLGLLTGLVRERHFGIAAGLTDEAAAAEAERLIVAARDRVLSARPQTWGEAVGDLNDQLRTCLHDRHLQIHGARRSRIRCDEPAAAVNQGAPAVEVEDLHGVLCVTIRRFMGSPDDDARLRAWARDGASHFSYARIVVDLRGNPGGSDAYLLEWIRTVRAEPSTPGTSGWFVGQAPLVVWNTVALIEACDGVDAVPGWLRAMRHAPAPDDVLQIRDDVELSGAAVPGEPPPLAGVRAWQGKMIVLVDAYTASSGETAAWMLQHDLGALLLGGRTAGMMENGDITPYLLPGSGLGIKLATAHNDFGMPVELVGLPVHAELDPSTPVSTVARTFDQLFAERYR